MKSDSAFERSSTGTKKSDSNHLLSLFFNSYATWYHNCKQWHGMKRNYVLAFCFWLCGWWQFSLDTIPERMGSLVPDSDLVTKLRSRHMKPQMRLAVSNPCRCCPGWQSHGVQTAGDHLDTKLLNTCCAHLGPCWLWMGERSCRYWLGWKSSKAWARQFACLDSFDLLSPTPPWLCLV